MRTPRAILLLLATYLGCATPSILKPAVGPGTDRPCDYVYEGSIVKGHSCGGQAHLCCDEGWDCGGFVPSCPAGTCCGRGSDFERQVQKKQYPEHT